MTQQRMPDFTNTPVSERRPRVFYTAEPHAAPGQSGHAPLVSIITAYYNVPAAIFQETVRSVERLSVPNWEWLIVNDGSTDEGSLRELESVAAREPRVRVIHQANGGPGVARNRAAREARAAYLFQLDADDLVEPTFVEKALWLLATQPQFAACNSYTVTFGAKDMLWPHGFHQYEYSLDDNRMTLHSLVRRDAWERIGGYDEYLSYQHADWDFWLNLAEAGLWGYTLPEYLGWYRLQERSLLSEVESDGARTRAFRAHLRAKHRGLRARFPHPRMSDPLAQQSPQLPTTQPFANPLHKPTGSRRLLLLAPWMEMGGADKFNLDLLTQLSARGYDCTVVTTAWSEDAWMERFTAVTPDVFSLRRFLTWADYPRFLDYLIASRGVDALLVSNSELGYGLLPWLRAQHPSLPILDYNHMEEPEWRDGGYPALSATAGRLLDRRLTCSEHLREWEVAHGASAATARAIYCGIDTEAWDPERVEIREEAAATRARLGISLETPLILFAGRMVEQKRPQLAGEILLALARSLEGSGTDFAAVVAGDGPELAPLTRRIARGRLSERVRFVGAQSEAQMRALTAAADIALLPSAREGIALVLYEAMAMGTVPVAAAVGGQGELITPECGYLIPQAPDSAEGGALSGSAVGYSADEVKRYVAALTTLVRHAEQRQAMAAACRARVVSQFDVRAMGVAMDAAISEAIVEASMDGASRVDMKPADAERQALLAVQAARRWEAAQAAQAGRSAFQWIAFARRTRERIIPMGSHRYLQYRRMRQRLSRASLARRPKAQQ
jgi:glycosyltransferase involved in cell wall biosynthesis/GT2 family glycosyltransferase